MLCAAAFALFPGTSAAEVTAGEEAIGGPCAAAFALLPGSATLEEAARMEAAGGPCAAALGLPPGASRPRRTPDMRLTAGRALWPGTGGRWPISSLR